jgi:hypothetical protein
VFDTEVQQPHDPDEVLHVGEASRPKGGGAKTIIERKEKGHVDERNGDNGPQRLPAFQGQTSGAFIADRQTDRD